MQANKDLELKELGYYTSSEHHWKNMWGKYTDGVKYIMNNGYAWFVTDAQIVIRMKPKLRAEEFLTVELKLKEDSTAQTVITDGNGNILYTQDYQWTDAKREIKLWDVESGQELNTLTGHTNWIKSIAFSPDGKILASGSVDEKIWLWNMDSGLQLRVLIGHTGQVTGVAFSPDGQLLASVSWDLTVRLWKVENGQELNALTGHTNWIQSITFSPDGATFVSGGYDHEVRLWGLPS